MSTTSRRFMLHGLAAGGAAIGAAAYGQNARDGHAAGTDVAPAANFMPVVPRKPGDPLSYTASLDRANIKATSGGWAREITARQLPVASDIAGAHLFLNPGGLREMHWHSSAEWAYVVAGNCQVAVTDPAGKLEVANYGPGDLWYFPPGHPHAIQALGNQPCHALLTFNDGLYGEHGTYGLTDVISRLDPALLAQHIGASATPFPAGETYIMQGAIVPLDSDAARSTQPLTADRSHRCTTANRAPLAASAGGTLHVVSARDFPLCADVTTLILRLAPGATQGAHWHPTASEWHYVMRGHTRLTVFGPDKKLAVAELGPGDCAYIPRACTHAVQNVGSAPCEVVGVLNEGIYQSVLLFDWLSQVPSHFVANNFGWAFNQVPALQRKGELIAAL